MLKMLEVVVLGTGRYESEVDGQRMRQHALRNPLTRFGTLMWWAKPKCTPIALSSV